MTQLSSDETKLTAPRLVVPAYFHAAVRPADWALLAERAADVRLVILNLASGPGASPEPAHLAALERLRAAGVAVAGYVDTNYGLRPVQEAMADLHSYLDWYQVTGVCFDRVATGAEHLNHYAALAHRARAAGAQLIMFNHGVHPAEAYAQHADLLGTFEGPWRAYLSAAVPRWTRSLPADKFYHVVHSVPREHIADAYLLAARRHAGCAYVTERSGGNPYDGLPADWTERRAATRCR